MKTNEKVEALKLIDELEEQLSNLKLQNQELVLATTTAQLTTKKYIEFFNLAPSGFFTLSKKGEIIDLNLNGAKMLGKERSKLKNTRFDFYISNDTKQQFKDFLDAIFDTKVKQFCELILSNNESSSINTLLTGNFTEDDKHCFLTAVDITKHKQVEQELIKAKEKAEESDRLKSAFLANMSHEIRTPMNGILGFTDLLKEPKLTGEEQKKYIRIIEKSGNRMLNVINDIMSISKVESGETEILISESNINEQTRYIFNFFKPEMEKKGLQFILKNGLPDIEAFIKTDIEKIYAILTNLVKNAIKFTQTGSIELGYELKNEYLEFYIKDTGDGIIDNVKHAIFDRFRQGNISPSRTHKGAGLGLSITKAYVEILGGEIWVDSTEGVGSTFYFTIPSKVESPEDNVFFKKTSVSKDENDLKDLKILIVEDDEASEMLITETCSKISREILKARTGIEAINICRNNPDIDLILMDIRMPEMNGYDATMEIRQFNKDVVIIAQTAYILKGDKKKAFEAGCDDYITKPFHRFVLIEMINKFFQKT